VLKNERLAKSDKFLARTNKKKGSLTLEGLTMSSNDEALSVDRGRVAARAALNHSNANPALRLTCASGIAKVVYILGNSFHGLGRAAESRPVASRCGCNRMPLCSIIGPTIQVLANGNLFSNGCRSA
jgi:hypothetical protein